MPKHIDIFDSKNRPTGQQMSISEALGTGARHRGANAVVISKNGYVVVQKRSERMEMNPGELDISCGGFVDAGESPEDAITRELYEELGIRISDSQLHLIRVYHKRLRIRPKNLFNRAFIYCYAVIVPSHDLEFVTQPSEVEWAKFIPIKEARRLIRKRHVRKLGKLEPAYNFYNRNLREAVKVLHKSAT